MSHNDLDQTTTNTTADLLSGDACLGIIGGGQLGRMIAVAASRYGLRCLVWSQNNDDPAAAVSQHLNAPYTSAEACDMFCQQCSMVTVEFEGVPISLLAAIAEKGLNIMPSIEVWQICSHRQKEKEFLASLGIPTALWRPVSTVSDVHEALADKAFGAGGIVKISRGGYDGKGQIVINKSIQQQESQWTQEVQQMLNSAHQAQNDHQQKTQENSSAIAIIESIIPFDCEVSIHVACQPVSQKSGNDRNDGHDIVGYCAVRNTHEKGILQQTDVPARIAPNLEDSLYQYAHDICVHLNLRGLLCVEAFVCDGRVIVNELAPRPHNSSHWTLDACLDSQFDLLVQALCGLPFPNELDRFANATMVNLIGDEVKQWRNIAKLGTDYRLHLYGKSVIKSGRKMGHVTQLHPKDKG